MDAIRYIMERHRMCVTYLCSDCPFSSIKEDCTGTINPEKTVAIVEKWSKEHPIITNLQKFEEVFGAGIRDIKAPNSWWCAEYEEPKGENDETD